MIILLYITFPLLLSCTGLRNRRASLLSEKPGAHAEPVKEAPAEEAPQFPADFDGVDRTTVAVTQPVSKVPVPGPTEIGVPNNTLFVQNVPLRRTQEGMEGIFSKFPGFKEVRLSESRPDIAFVEYDSAIEASRALQALQGRPTEEGSQFAIRYARQK